MRYLQLQSVREGRALRWLKLSIFTEAIFYIVFGIFVGWHLPMIIKTGLISMDVEKKRNIEDSGQQMRQSKAPNPFLFNIRVSAKNMLSMIMQYKIRSGKLNGIDELHNETARTFPLEDDAHRNERIIADYVASEVYVFCWIMTDASRHRTYVRAVNTTWAQRCNKHLFVSSSDDNTLPTINLGFHKSRNSWRKVRSMLKFVHMHYLDQYDWFLAATDDSYVILENLRYLLLQYSPQEALVFGSHIFTFPKLNKKSSYSLQGFILSKEAVRKIVIDGLKSSKNCTKEKGNELELMWMCFQNSGVRFVDSRDRENAHLILPLKPQEHVAPYELVFNTTAQKWLENASDRAVFPSGMDCCSEYPISFHTIPYRGIYALEFLIYRQRIFGVDMPAMRYGDERMVWSSLFGDLIENHEF
ncbi:hypothetical protein RB195_008607 [Necator americanus]|uniref:N-acetylgalactosaminide beta-1,3-galactosyltransferase n=1 Tax=Necator americanus TaxID=51031 RepID=A0ABR1CRB2_NECAM